jgi:hypothetical protein
LNIRIYSCSILTSFCCKQQVLLCLSRPSCTSWNIKRLYKQCCLCCSH